MVVGHELKAGVGRIHFEVGLGTCAVLVEGDDDVEGFAYGEGGNGELEADGV